VRWLWLLLAAAATLAFLFAVVIPALIVLGIFLWHAVLPWLALGLLLWAGLSFANRPRRGGWARHDVRRATWARPVPPSPSARPASQVDALPIDLRVKVEQIRRKAEVLQDHASRFPPFSEDLYTVRQIASDYLPRTVQAYLSLPPMTRDRVVTPNGKTALQELREQLDLLDRKLDEIAAGLQRQNLDRLLANRRFLEERFGRTEPRPMAADQPDAGPLPEHGPVDRLPPDP